jgi:hypothetical protein
LTHISKSERIIHHMVGLYQRVTNTNLGAAVVEKVKVTEVIRMTEVIAMATRVWPPARVCLTTLGKGAEGDEGN